MLSPIQGVVSLLLRLLLLPLPLAPSARFLHPLGQGGQNKDSCLSFVLPFPKTCAMQTSVQRAPAARRSTRTEQRGPGRWAPHCLLDPRCGNPSARSLQCSAPGPQARAATCSPTSPAWKGAGGARSCLGEWDPRVCVRQPAAAAYGTSRQPARPRRSPETRCWWRGPPAGWGSC